MNITTKFAVAAALTLSVSAANAQVIPVEGPDNVNLIGIGAGGAPDYMGSDHTKAYPVILGRYQFEGTQRSVTLLGNQVMANILDDDTWRFGPQLTYRGGRGSDVDNATVKQMVGINGAVEGGVFLQYKMKLSNEKLHQITFTGDINGGSNGGIGGLRMLWWQPLSPQLVMTLGAGMQYASDKWMNTYFGVTNAHDIALYPTLRGQAYNASSGVKGVNIPVGLTYFVDRNWVISGGGRYEKLQGDAKDSPVTAISGKDSQVIFGAAVSYIF